MVYFSFGFKSNWNIKTGRTFSLKGNFRLNLLGNPDDYYEIVPLSEGYIGSFAICFIMAVLTRLVICTIYQHQRVYQSVLYRNDTREAESDTKQNNVI